MKQNVKHKAPLLTDFLTEPSVDHYFLQVGFGMNIDAINNPSHPFTKAINDVMKAAAESSFNPTAAVGAPNMEIPPRGIPRHRSIKTKRVVVNVSPKESVFEN